MKKTNEAASIGATGNAKMVLVQRAAKIMNGHMCEKKMGATIIDFFKSHTAPPTDAQVHKLASGMGISKDLVENAVYKMLHMFIMNKGL